jgi:hypothetical protein
MTRRRIQRHPRIFSSNPTVKVRARVCRLLTLIGHVFLDVRFHESCHNGGIHLGFSDSHIGRVNP